MKTISVYGEYLRSKNPIGVARVSNEILYQLDEILTDKDAVELVVPEDVDVNYNFKNIRIVKLRKAIIKHSWQQHIYGKYVKQNGRLPLVITSWGLYSYDGYFYIHDINYIDHPENFEGLKRKLIRLHRIIGNKLALRKAKLVFTVSEYQKKRIVEHYKMPTEKVKVIYHGWEHMQRIEVDESIFEKYPEIIRHKYFFSVGSVIKYKNIKWAINLAKKNPKYQFVFAGKIFKTDVNEITNGEQLPNVIFLGFVSDEEMKALMANAKALLYPSLYEGFGIPPLEAIACGTDAIVSTETCLPEVYESNVYYIDPYDFNVTIEDIYKQPINAPAELLNKYSWKKAAEQLWNIIKENEEKYNGN